MAWRRAGSASQPHRSPRSPPGRLHEPCGAHSLWTVEDSGGQCAHRVCSRYWALAARLATRPSPLAGPPWSPLHALAALLVAAASSAFHGCVLFGGGAASYERVTARLLVLDIVAANGYGVALACYAGLADAAAVFAVPLALLTWSAVAKRSGQPVTYAVGHGAWHLLSAAALWRLHYSSGTA